MSNSITIYKLDSWAQFIEAVRCGPIRNMDSDDTPYPNHVLYRGHAKAEWKLWSPLDRRLVAWLKDNNGELEYWSHRKDLGLEWYDAECAKILNQFKQSSYGMPGVDPGMEDDEYWALGRHFDLLTPLLDWTLSPYVAAFFAFAERLKLMMRGGTQMITIKGNEGSVRVWAIAIWQNIEKKGEFEIVRPKRMGARQRAQSGVFTRLRSEEHLELEPYFLSRQLADCLFAYDIPIDAASHALRDLQLMNITPATLFPDPFGAAWQANLDNLRIHHASLTYDYNPANSNK
jgi:hypothetical protein